MGLNMTKNTKSVLLASYPHLWRWITEIGTVEIGYPPSGLNVARRRSFT